MTNQQKINGIIDAIKSISAIIGEEDTTIPAMEYIELHQLRKDLLELAKKLNSR